MDQKFPQIKNNSVLPYYNPIITTNKIIHNKKQEKRTTSNNKTSLNSPHSSRLPPINSSMDLSVTISDLHPNLHTRRTLSHYDLSGTKKAVKHFTVKSKTGSLKGKPKSFNQDSYIILPSLISPNLSFFAVCDGHGTEGHLVSGMIKSHIPEILEKHLANTQVLKALNRAVIEISQKILASKIDTSLSGSTFVGVLIQGENLFCANVGDSAAVIGNYSDEWRAVKLTEDHSPARRDEAQRILSKGGRISSHAQGGPLRIWLRDQNMPGLAMTRSIGDKTSISIGLISDPEISSRKIRPSDKFVIIASDGLWEFISEIEAVNIVAELVVQGKRDQACSKLIQESVIRWNSKGMSVDDITIIVVFFM